MGRHKNDGRGRLGGRQKGTPNKVTASDKFEISQILDKYFRHGEVNMLQFEEDLGAMDPYSRARIMLSLLPYVLPKLAPEVAIHETPRKSFQEELDELMEERK